MPACHRWIQVPSSHSAVPAISQFTTSVAQAQPTAPPGVTPTAPASNFADTLNAVVAKVNETQEQEDVVTEAYERGETTDIATVALIQSRASITFEATLQVRNKLLSAYRDIMNMPIG